MMTMNYNFIIIAQVGETSFERVPSYYLLRYFRFHKQPRTLILCRMVDRTHQYHHCHFPRTEFRKFRLIWYLCRTQRQKLISLKML